MGRKVGRLKRELHAMIGQLHLPFFISNVHSVYFYKKGGLLEANEITYCHHIITK